MDLDVRLFATLSRLPTKGGSVMVEENEEHQYTSTKELTLEKLLVDIAYELADPDYQGRTHARNDVYRDGCRGPLCKYRERTRKREAREARTRASLPGGVQPMRRVRSEQRWDNVIEATLDEIRTLGARQWLDARDAVRITVSVPELAESFLAPVHPESGGSCGDAVAMRLLPPAHPRIPVQRFGGEEVRP